jgi:signal transduction histidine kinase
VTALNLFEEHKLHLCQRIDRAFAALMLVQWFVAVVVAMNFPSSNPNQVLMAFIFGGLFSILPIFFALYRPGEFHGRLIIACSQMCFSSLFIHLMGGRMEAHFHIFGSLAFLSAYREWRLLGIAASVIILDHCFRGIYFPTTLYGPVISVEWRWLEHAGWILFEVMFLCYACIQAKKEMWQTAVTKAELINARIEADKINIQRTQYFSLISHELRTPLSGIIGFADFLNEAPLPPEQKEYVHIIKQCSDTLLKLINDLLDFNKIDNGLLEIDPHTFKTQDVQDYLESVFLLECQKKSLNFSVQVAPEVPQELVGDSHRIRQVLTNIIGNAIKFTEHGAVVVRCSRHPHEENTYRWEVEDTGIGIKPDSLTKIFSPYTQEFSSTARKYGGSGLGLAISKTLVELMGGKLEVQSTLGKGTLFSFTLPLK